MNNKVVYVHKLNDEVVYVGSGAKDRTTNKVGRSDDHLKRMNIRSLPTVILFNDDGKELYRSSGVTAVEKLKNYLGETNE